MSDWEDDTTTRTPATPLELALIALMLIMAFTYLFGDAA